jgi:hypothetical protein
MAIFHAVQKGHGDLARALGTAPMNVATSHMRDAAIALAEIGYSVLPLHTAQNGKCSCGKAACKSPAKHPLVTHGVRNATSDPSQIRAWWQKWPNANIGIAMGAPSGVFVVDFDGPEAEVWLVEQERTFGALPATVEATTARGRHLYFWVPRDKRRIPNATCIAPKVDLRGNGGYVLAPPSLHASGVRYEWKGDIEECAEAPDWLLALISAPAAPAKASRLLGTPPASSARQQNFLGDCGERPLRSDNFARTHSALMAIPNTGPSNWDRWNRIGMACWTAFAAGEAGRAAFHAWSALNAAYNAETTDERWQHYFQSPPDRIGQGAIEYEARKHGWQWQEELLPATFALPAPGFVSIVSTVSEGAWAAPDMSVLRTARRSAPAFPLDALGGYWANWCRESAQAAAAPVDYVALPLLATTSALIGNARWAAIGGWREPPHLWIGLVGESGSSKTPGANAVLRDIVPCLENRMRAGFPDRLQTWKLRVAERDVQEAIWKDELKKAVKEKKQVPPQPLPPSEPEPQAPRLVQNDVTIEKVATIMATAAEKGLLIHRDELAGWFLGMTAYNDSGRQFWLEAYNGNPYRVERQKNPEPIIVSHLSAAVIGGVQPERLAPMLADADDGLFARMLWAWPEPLQFRLGQAAPDQGAAIEALDRLRRLEMRAGMAMDARQPIPVQLAKAARPLMEQFGQRMQAEQEQAGGLMRSAYGKARGLALRLSLVLTFLEWCAGPSDATEPQEISEAALAAACEIVASYFMAMAQRVYGDAATPPAERNTATLSRWIMRTKPSEIHVRALQRQIRLPGLADAASIHEAADLLIEAGWLRAIGPASVKGRPKAAYSVNPAIWDPAFAESTPP